MNAGVTHAALGNASVRTEKEMRLYQHDLNNVQNTETAHVKTAASTSLVRHQRQPSLNASATNGFCASIHNVGTIRIRTL